MWFFLSRIFFFAFAFGFACVASSGWSVRHVTPGLFGTPRDRRSQQRQKVGKSTTEMSSRERRVYLARAMRVKWLAAAFRGVKGGKRMGVAGGWKGRACDVATRRRIVCKNLVKSLTKRQSDWVGVKRNAAANFGALRYKVGGELNNVFLLFTRSMRRPAGDISDKVACNFRGTLTSRRKKSHRITPQVSSTREYLYTPALRARFVPHVFICQVPHRVVY